MSDQPQILADVYHRKPRGMQGKELEAYSLGWRSAVRSVAVNLGIYSETTAAIEAANLEQPSTGETE